MAERDVRVAIHLLQTVKASIGEALALPPDDFGGVTLRAGRIELWFALVHLSPALLHDPPNAGSPSYR